MHVACIPALVGLCGWHEMTRGVSSPKRKNKQTNSSSVGSWSAVEQLRRFGSVQSFLTEQEHYTHCTSCLWSPCQD